MSILYGSGPPTTGQGEDGDFYIDYFSHAIYGPRVSGNWTSATSLIGPRGLPGEQGIQGNPGPQGSPAHTIYNGPGAPASGLGSIGDFYIDTGVLAFYGPKTAGGWGGPTSIIGPTGPSVYLPVGGMITWPSETVPPGFLERNGASLSRTTYTDLFHVIGTIYGAADNTHFNLPDHRGYFPRYWDHGAGRDPDKSGRSSPPGSGAAGIGGDHAGTSEAAQIGTFDYVFQKQAGMEYGTVSDLPAISADGYVLGTVTVPFGGSETRPINVYEMPLIKY